LKSIFNEKKAFLAEKVESGLSPTPAQIGEFLRQLSTSIGTVIQGCPAQVQRLVKRKFSDIGWDVGTNRSFKASPPTVEDLNNLVTSTLQELNNFHQPAAVQLVKDEELADLSKACSRLWELDTNRLQPGVDYELDLQHGKKIYQEADVATRPLFKSVSEAALNRPTFRRFIALLDNYERGSGVAETVSANEQAEERALIIEMMGTPCMKYLHKYLLAKGLAPAGEDQFKTVLNELWFKLYRRVVDNDSSGFEHVFVGEAKDGAITGLHNWVQLYLEEKKGELDYMGYIYPRNPAGRFTDPDSNEQLISLQFTWGGLLKNCSSSFFGTSPEFEFALLTLCFLAGEQENIVTVGPYRALITCYKFNSRGKTYIGSAFPSEAPLSEEQAASKIQALARGRQVRQQGAEVYQAQVERNEAATKIQATYRGSRAR